MPAIKTLYEPCLVAPRMLIACAQGKGPKPRQLPNQMQFAVPNSYSGRPHRSAGQAGVSAGMTFRKVFTATQPPSSHNLRGCAFGRATDKENPKDRKST